MAGSLNTGQVESEPRAFTLRAGARWHAAPAFDEHDREAGAGRCPTACRSRRVPHAAIADPARGRAYTSASGTK